MTVVIRGLGTASPRHSIEQADSVAFAETMLSGPDDYRRRLAALYRITMVERRGSVLLEQDGEQDCEPGVRGRSEQSFYPLAGTPGERGPTTSQRSQRYAIESVPLGEAASRAALTDAGTSAAAVTHLVVATCTGFNAPGLDVGLMNRLDLSPETQRVQVGFMGCHAAVNALRVARGLIAADRQATVLLVCVELCSLHFQYGWETDRVVSNAIFADGAAAMILTAADHPAILGGRSMQVGPVSSDTSTCRAAPIVRDTGSRLIAGTEAAMTWQIADHGFEMTLSAEVPGIIEAELKPYLAGWLSGQGLQIGDIRGWVVHPGGPRILRAVQTALGLVDEDLRAARAVLACHGNMSSPTMLFIIERLRQESCPRPWLMLGFGPGLEIEVALID